MKGKKALFFVFALVLLPAYHLLAQTTASVQTKKELITNETIIELAKLGLSDDLIIEKIRQSERQFDTSIDGIKKLKGAGISDVVLKEMISPKVASPASIPPPTSSLAQSNPNDPTALHEPGIYLQEEGKLLKLEPTNFSQARSGNWLKSRVTAGIATQKSKAVLPGAHAKLQITQSKPIFYFCFGDQTTGIAGPIMGATSPNEFVLVKMDQKKDKREIVVGETRVITGSSSTGIKEKDIIGFSSQKLSTNLYKVIIDEALASGEYCFYFNNMAIMAAQAGGGKLFDFTVSKVSQ